MKVYVVYVEVFDPIDENLVGCGVDAVFDSAEKAIEHIKACYGDNRFAYNEVEGWALCLYETDYGDYHVNMMKWEVN